MGYPGWVRHLANLLDTITDWPWRRAWWIAMSIHTAWVLGLISWSITWSDQQVCGGEGMMGSGSYACWESEVRLGVWSFLIPLIGLASAAIIPPRITHVSPLARQAGVPIWLWLTCGLALVVGALVAVSLYCLWLVYRFLAASL